jgi:hypothetical protein
MIDAKRHQVAPWPTPEELDRLVRRAEALAREPESARRRTAMALARLATAASRGTGKREDGA